MVTLPVYYCLHSESHFNISEWLLQEESHVYIGSKTFFNKKTCKLEGVSDWSVPWLDQAFFDEEISLGTYFTYYEDFIRHYKWDELDTLEGKKCGCWCKDKKMCKFTLIHRLFIEKKTIQQEYERNQQDEKRNEQKRLKMQSSKSFKSSRLIHKRKKKYRCRYCSYKTYNYSNYNEHKTVLHYKPKIVIAFNSPVQRSQNLAVHCDARRSYDDWEVSCRKFRNDVWLKKNDLDWLFMDE